MKTLTYSLKTFVLMITIILTSCTGNGTRKFGNTVITRWQDGKPGAVSLTFDDGSINQFRVAMPVMDSLGFPGTFFIITGDMPDPVYKPGFIGRQQEEIIKETASLPTNSENLFERASLIAYAPYSGLRSIFTKAGEEFEAGKPEDACRLIDEAYKGLRDHKLKLREPGNNSGYKGITWEEVRAYAGNGHEFASHTITHPRLAILDSANLVYELEGSRKEMLEKLGEKFTFSAECPYGTEDERVMKFAHQYYPALRNRMPESYLEELNRGSKKSPVSPDMEYVQWQRGALTSTPMEMMKSWIDTCAANENIWLVLVFHGVDGIGWEALTGKDLRSYYSYIKSKEDKLWVGTFGNVAKYMHERMNAKLETTIEEGRLVIRLNHNLGNEYDYPLTLKTYLPGSSEILKIEQGNNEIDFSSGKDEKGPFVTYQVIPNSNPVKLSVR
jgi:peptidoglycan/xylan/chitin deacetylase (PgdA/CDA1 family)